MLGAKLSSSRGVDDELCVIPLLGTSLTFPTLCEMRSRGNVQLTHNGLIYGRVALTVLRIKPIRRMKMKLTAEQKKLVDALHKTLKPRQFLYLENELVMKFPKKRTIKNSIRRKKAK